MHGGRRFSRLTIHRNNVHLPGHGYGGFVSVGGCYLSHIASRTGGSGLGQVRAAQVGRKICSPPVQPRLKPVTTHTTGRSSVTISRCLRGNDMAVLRMMRRTVVYVSFRHHYYAGRSQEYEHFQFVLYYCSPWDRYRCAGSKSRSYQTRFREWRHFHTAPSSIYNDHC